MRNKTFGLVGGPLAAIAVGGLLAANHFPSGICWTAAITTLVALWWVLEPIPIPASSMIPFAAFPLCGVLNHNQVATAYGHSLILLLMAGSILSLAMEKSGAHRRLALTMVNLVGGTNGRRLVLGFMIAAAGLSMWISNTATVLMLLPVALAILEQAEERKQLAVPLLLGLAYATNIGGIGTPVGTPPNVIFMAQYKAHTGNDWSFARWMMLGVPIVVIFTPLAWLWLTRGLRTFGKLTIPPLGPWRPEECRTLIAFAVTAVLWITRTEPLGGWNGILERIFRYQSSGENTLSGDSTVALLMAVLMFVLPNGKGGRLLDWEQARQVPWGLLLLFGGGLAIGMAFKESGLSGAIGQLLSGITAWGPIVCIGLICLVVTFLTEITSNTATTNVMLPILAAACLGTNGQWLVPPEQLMVPAAISASCAFMLPVATAPNAIVFGTSDIATSRMIQEGIVMNFVGIAVVTLVCYFVIG